MWFCWIHLRLCFLQVQFLDTKPDSAPGQSTLWNYFSASSDLVSTPQTRAHNGLADILKYVRKRSWYSFNSWNHEISPCSCLLVRTQYFCFFLFFDHKDQLLIASRQLFSHCVFRANFHKNTACLVCIYTLHDNHSEVAKPVPYRTWTFDITVKNSIQHYFPPVHFH